MATRKSSLMGGLTYDISGGQSSMSAGYFHDLNSASRGGYVDLLFSKSLIKDEHWDISGTFELTRLDSKVVNYYFGVTTVEVSPSRPFYRPGSSTTFALWLTGQYNFTKRYALMFGAEVTQLAGAAAGSPIVERRKAPLIYLGLGTNL